MAEVPSIEAEVVHKLPDNLLREIGRVVVAYSKLENHFINITAIILQLQKPEARLAFGTPPVFERLDVVQDLLALKGLTPDFDFVKFREHLKLVNSWRNNVAHGIWLKHPTTKQIYLRLTRGQWQKQPHKQPVRRVVYPEAIPITAKELRLIRKQVELAITSVDNLGKFVDHALQTWPDKFRPRAPLVDPLARRKAPRPPNPRGASQGKSEPR